MKYLNSTIFHSIGQEEEEEEGGWRWRYWGRKRFGGWRGAKEEEEIRQKGEELWRCHSL